MLLIIISFFILASIVSVYSYGRFAKRAKGEPSYTLPLQDEQTSFDCAITKELEQYPEQTGLQIVRDNLEAFSVRAMSAREAGRSLDLQYYIWNDDLTGRLLSLEVLRAADRGVRVRILLDDLNAHGRNSFLAALNLHPNIEIRMFNPTVARDKSLIRGVEMLLRIFSVNRRMHNKAWIVDGRIAVVGGRNIGDEYFDAADDRNFFDIDLLIGGTAVADASQIFDEFWNSEVVIPLSVLLKPKHNALEKWRNNITANYQSIAAQPYIKKLLQSPSVQSLFRSEYQVCWTDDIHIFSDPPEKAFALREKDWLINKLLPVWHSAVNDFKIISPYFIPGRLGVNKFKQLRQNNVNIDILTNSLATNDVIMAHGGYAPYRKTLLKEGIHLYELKPFGPQDKSLLGSHGASLHTKAFLVDDNIGFVGSFNFDARSAKLNTEMGVLFSQATIADGLKQEFDLRTNANYSYFVTLQKGKLLWQDTPYNGAMAIWHHDPQSKWWQRVMAKVIGWLPIQSWL